MTKLFQWLLGLFLYLAIWLGLLINKNNSKFVNDWFIIIKYSPVISVLLFGMLSLSIVLWRVYTFNDCPEAAKELQEQIIKTKEELRRKGLEIE
ncbi:hypothetical protein O3M35_002093 [Rhynocoris fuscipes]|uniref:Dolichol-phosphate mannosyltransferase subunit 3 n=1 Tax=Rhynocoris fuscipes TaxID=488301 RepID=A0AAW1CPU6_9HEMI